MEGTIMHMLSVKQLFVLCLTFLASCKPISRDKSSLDATGQAGPVNLSTRLVDWVTEKNMQVSLRNIANAMGYGWVLGCPVVPGYPMFPTGYVSTGLLEKADGTSTIDFVPADSSACPKDQPAMKMTVGYNVKIGTIKTLSTTARRLTIGKELTSPFTCGKNTGDCSISRNITTSTMTKTDVLEEIMDTKAVTNGEAIAVNFKGTIPGVLEASLNVNQSYSVATTFSKKVATTQGTQQTNQESLTVTCPLEKQVSGHAYKGTLKSYPTEITTIYEGDVSLVPYVIFSGFPRAQDGNGNHWTDHPTNRPIRNQKFGNATSDFISDLRAQHTARGVSKDVNSAAYFSWLSLSASSFQDEAVKKELTWLEGRKSTLNASGSSLTAKGKSKVTRTIDEIVCEWEDLTLGTSAGKANPVVKK
jgi:hypothetical protein